MYTLGTNSRTFCCACQIYMFTFWGYYENWAFRNMNCIKSFIFFNFDVIRYASVGIEDEPESKNAMFT